MREGGVHTAAEARSTPAHGVARSRVDRSTRFPRGHAHVFNSRKSEDPLEAEFERVVPRVDCRYCRERSGL